jgi:hypothetical protein
LPRNEDSQAEKAGSIANIATERKQDATSLMEYMAIFGRNSNESKAEPREKRYV